MRNFNSNTIRWGIIGCGNVTELKSGPAYRLTKGFELTAVMRRNLEKAQDYARRHQVPNYYDDADKIINSPEIDAVYIATPPDSHREYALRVAEAKKPCCIEKPMALNYEDCLIIYNAFEERNTPLFVAYYRRTLPRFLKIKDWLNSEEIGAVKRLSWVLSKPPNAFDLEKRENWRTDVKVAPGGYFDDLASHGLDLFHFFFGEVIEAQGTSKNHKGLYSAPDMVIGSWIHRSGATGTGSWNFGALRQEDRVEIYGEKGKITFSIFSDEPIVLENSKGRKELVIDHPKHVQSCHVDAMRKHLLETNFRHPSTGKTALHTSWIMDKILGKI